MNPGFRSLGGLLAAVTIPALVLISRNPVERELLGLDVPPFGTRNVFLVHLLLTLPLGLLLGSLIRQIESARAILPGTWIVLGLLSVGVLSLIATVLPDVSADLGFTGALILRSTLGLLLVLPWCCLVPLVGTVEFVSPRWQLLAAIALSLIPPAVYTDSVVSTQRQRLTEHLARQRLVKAIGLARLLQELGDDAPLGQQSLRQVHDQLRQTIAQQEDRLRIRPDDNAPDWQRIDRALILITLNRLEQAAELLQPLMASHDIALMLMATVEQERENWSASNAAFEKILAAGPRNRPYETDALDGLIFNARSSRHPEDVERWLQYALKNYPARRGHYAFQYAQHFSQAGQPRRAIEWYHDAIAADEQLRTKAEQEIDHLRFSTPACLVGLGK